MTTNDDTNVRRETIAYDAAGIRLTPDLPPRPANTPPRAREAAPRAVDPLRGQAEAIINDWEEQASERDRRDPMRARIMQEAAVIRAALAATPQTAPTVAVKPLQWVDRPEMTDPITGEVVEASALAGDYHYLAEAVGCSLDTAKRRADRKHREFILSQIEAAPQPAPVDREALVAVIRKAESRNQFPLADCFIERVLDALIAAGLRLPEAVQPRRCAECDCEGGGHECNWIKPGPGRDRAPQPDEMLAWAVVGEDGTLIETSINRSRAEAEGELKWHGARIVRVAIRRVEDEA